MADPTPPKQTEATARKRVDFEIDRVGAQAQLLSGRRGIEGGTLSKKQIGKKAENKSEFEDFLENVENGFAGKPGINAALPYGKPKAQRPKIRIL